MQAQKQVQEQRVRVIYKRKGESGDLSLVVRPSCWSRKFREFALIDALMEVIAPQENFPHLSGAIPPEPRDLALHFCFAGLIYVDGDGTHSILP